MNMFVRPSFPHFLLNKTPITEKATLDKPGFGFTLVELLVVIAIICVLSVVLLPVIKSSIRKSQATVCAGNLRQIYMACLSYSADTGYLPFAGDTSTGANRWQTSLLDGGYLTDSRVTMCPSLLRPGAILSATTLPPSNQGYGMLVTPSPLQMIRHPDPLGQKSYEEEIN